MRNILAENERQNNSRGSGISVSASSSGPRYSRSQSRYNVDLRQGLVSDFQMVKPYSWHFVAVTDTMIDESHLTVENHLKGRRISHPDNSPSRRTQHWSYQISGDSLEQIARERLAAGNTTGNSTANSTGNTTGSSDETSNSNSSSTSNSPLASISNSTDGGRTVHHSFHVPERSFPG